MVAPKGSVAIRFSGWHHTKGFCTVATKSWAQTRSTRIRRFWGRLNRFWGPLKKNLGHDIFVVRWIIRSDQFFGPLRGITQNFEKHRNTPNFSWPYTPPKPTMELCPNFTKLISCKDAFLFTRITLFHLPPRNFWQAMCKFSVRLKKKKMSCSTLVCSSSVM